MSKTEITTDRAWIEFGVVRWYDQLARRIEEARADEETGEAPFCEVVPLERLNAFRFSAVGLAGVIVTVAIANGCAFASFHPEIPIEATQFKTAAPVKTRPINSDDDLKALAESIAMFAGTDFLEWQGTAILESQKAAEWAGMSAALLQAVESAPWGGLSASLDDAGTLSLRGLRLQVKANADGLSVKYTGKPSNYFEVLRSLFVRRDPS